MMKSKIFALYKMIFGTLHKDMWEPAHLLKQHFNCSKVKPRVRLMKQQLNPHSGGARLTCLATGFYPRHINMTLLKDGQGMPEHLFTVDDLLPNADGTYQMRKTVEISEEEL
ncbi:hypothetical protein AMELA_G00288770 [Ameiurus melas]|uniref:Immunoglobulin C1-set domain-containing protein n=1 Tax=Ameiurus melas TaxID=219545 RepID=A0A7J5ZLA0_AMEME|nr:hypothetical protein AMELA_G00288770 [Ameiurus melas]